MLKNRTIISIICIVLAAVLCFAIAPLFSNIFSGTEEVITLRSDVIQGTLIDRTMLSTAHVAKTDASRYVVKADDIIGKYAKSYLFAGAVTPSMFEEEISTIDSRLLSLGVGESAMSITVQSLAGGVSGKLKNGDVITIATLDEDGNAVIYDELKFIEVIATTNEDGLDVNGVVTGEDSELPSTITVKLIDDSQIARLIECEDGTLHAVFVSRDENICAEYLEKQKAYFAEKSEETPNEPQLTDTTTTAPENEGEEID